MIQLSLMYKMSPRQIKDNFTGQDVARIFAFKQIESEEIEKAQREAKRIHDLEERARKARI